MSAVNRETREKICTNLLLRQEHEPFLNHIVTGDEKWILYKNTVRKKQWVNQDETPGATAKPDLHVRKVMLIVFWDVEGIKIFHEYF